MSRSGHNRRVNAYLAAFVAGIIIGCIGLVVYLMIRPKPPAVEKVPLVYSKKHIPVQPQFRVAIVLDDFGYNNKNVEATISLTRPVTFSILPNLPYSTYISRRVNQAGLEVILHLPLEPRKGERYVTPEVNTININMKRQDVVDRVDKDITSLVGIKGVSNHQGSKATEDAGLMSIVFSELKRKNMYFLDSLVSNKSVCQKTAKKVGIQFAKRDVFLDNKEDFEYIKGQMDRVIKEAKAKGYAIGIGHDRKATIAALTTLMPEAEKQGIEFVFLSELVK